MMVMMLLRLRRHNVVVVVLRLIARRFLLRVTQIQGIVSAEKFVVFEREFVALDELLFASRASETLQMVQLVLGPHHQIGLAEELEAFVALRTE